MSPTGQGIDGVSTSHRSGKESDSSDGQDGCSGGEDISKMPTKGSLRTITLKTKAKSKKLLHMTSGSPPANEAASDHDGVLRHIEDNPAFNPGKLGNPKHPVLKSTTEKTLGVFQTAATTVAHPRQATKSKFTRTTAGQLSKMHKLDQEADLDLLDAHEDLENAESSRSSGHTLSDDEDVNSLAEGRRAKVEALEAHRESTRVAWITGQIERVRVVPKRHLEYPQRSAFVERDGHGSVVRYQWEKLLGYSIIYYTQDFTAQYIDDFDDLPFDIDTLRKHVERIIMASGPWQSWALEVRSVYRWEDSKKTGRWLALYLVLWYTRMLRSPILLH